MRHVARAGIRRGGGERARGRGRHAAAAAAQGAGHGYRSRRGARACQRKAGARSHAGVQGQDSRTQAGDEADRRRGRIRQQQDGVLLHGQRARGLPRAGKGFGGGVQDAHRAAPDRCARRGQALGRSGTLRQTHMLRLVPVQLPAGVHKDGQGTEPVAQSDQDIRSG